MISLSNLPIEVLSSIRAQIMCANFPRIKSLSQHEKEPLLRQAGSGYDKTNKI
jgi:hypothetical protein